MVRIAAQGVDVYGRRWKAALSEIDAHPAARFFDVNLPDLQRFEYRFKFRIQV
jgi:hypothetical protein